MIIITEIQQQIKEIEQNIDGKPDNIVQKGNDLIYLLTKCGEQIRELYQDDMVSMSAWGNQELEIAKLNQIVIKLQSELLKKDEEINELKSNIN